MKKYFLIIIVLGLASGHLTAQPVITSSPVNEPVVWGGNAEFSVMATGIGPLTYQWQLNGTNLPNNIISTVAGGILADGLAATNVFLNSPGGTAIDSAGNLFVADMNSHVIRKVATNGMAKIIAGLGVSGFAGDGGPATNALLWAPAAVALDTNGNLFISDSANNRVRKVDTNGIITTVAGNGGSTSSHISSGTATNIPLNFPIGLALDKARNLYIADEDNDCIREVSPGGSLATVAGTVGSLGFSGDNSQAGTAKLALPSGVALDKAGNIYIADTGNNRIRKVNTSGFISTIAGTGTAGYSGDGLNAASANVNAPDAITVDANTNLIIADTANQRVRRITNGIIQTIAGTGQAGFSGDGGAATSATLCLPQSVNVDISGNVYIADAANYVRRVGPDGVIVTVAGRALNDGDLAFNAALNTPSGIAQDSAGNLYVADTFNYRIRKISANGIISTCAGNGIPGFAGDGGTATNASLKLPWGVAVDSVNNLLVADMTNRRVRKVDTNGIISTIAGNGTILFSGDGGAATNAGVSPNGVAADAFGNVFIADSMNSRIRKVDTNGIITTVAGNGGFTYPGDGGRATNAGILAPNSMFVDRTGNLFISATTRAYKVDTNGNIFTLAGNGTSGDSGDGGAATNASLRQTFGIVADSAGNVYIADVNSARVRKVGTNGIITTIVGTGVRGPATDNVPAAGTALAGPRSICLDSSGNLLIADAGANRIRKLAYLEYADQSDFVVTNVTPCGLSNTYSVIITSGSGSVTSSVVNVLLQLPPIMPVFTTASGTFNFTWNSVSNVSYQLQYATNLLAPNWQNLGPLITATNGTVSAADVPGADAPRFYRVQWQQ